MKNQALIAFLGGAVLGAAAALLFAPDKGEVTRKKIKEIVRREQDKLIHAAKGKIEEINCNCEHEHEQ